MNTTDGTPPSAKSFQDACRREFAFLVRAHAFTEVAPAAGEGPDEVVFEKESWKIAVVRTAHGTKASIVIYSPDGRLGFFSHLIDRDFEKQKRPEFAAGLLGDVCFHACCLQTFGSPFLRGEWLGFEVLEQAQRRFIIESGIMSAADLRRFYSR